MGTTEANRKYYQANKERRAALNQEIRTRNYAYVNSLKDNAECVDCGARYPYYVMDFDHLGDKEYNVSDMCRNMFSMDKLKAEIAKCEIVCANCHRIRTHTRRVSL